jgi:hypothetical protein
MTRPTRSIGAFPPGLRPIELPSSNRPTPSSPFIGSQTNADRRGKIIAVNSQDHTYQVLVGRATQPITVGRMLQDPSDAAILPVGTWVGLTYDYGPPLISGVIPFTAGRSPLVPPAATGSTEAAEPAVNTGGGVYRLPHMPANLLPGDKAIVSPDGNLIGAFAGGLNTMKSGLAEVRTHKLKDLVEVFCRNFRHLSDMGIAEIKSEDGRANWSFRGGAHQATENGVDQENWSIRIDLGADGDLFTFALTQPDGSSLFRLHIDAEGRVELNGMDGIDQFSGRDWNESALGDHTVTVAGNETKALQGQQQETVNGNHTKTVSGSSTRVVGNDLTETVIRHRTDSVGGNVLETAIGGNPLTAIPLQVARKTKVVNGCWEIAIGNPLDGANPVALAGYALSTYTGDISLAVKVLGNVFLSTLLGNATLQTTAGLATLKTLAGIANVDGTTVLLGPLAVAPANPNVKGTIYAGIFSGYCATAMTACTTAIGACSAAAASSIPGLPVDGSVMQAFASVMLTAFTTLNAALATLQSGLPTSLSTVVFTA